MKKIAGLALAGLIVVGGFNFVSADEPVQEENNTYRDSNECARGLTDEEREAFRAERRANGMCGQGMGRGMGKGLGCQNFEAQQQ